MAKTSTWQNLQTPGRGDDFRMVQTSADLAGCRKDSSHSLTPISEETDDDMSQNTVILGRPGIPGTFDLSETISKLDQNSLAKQDSVGEGDLQSRRIKDNDTYASKRSSTWHGGQSVMHTSKTFSNRDLLLVKTVGGSTTLTKWQHLSHGPCLENGALDEQTYYAQPEHSKIVRKIDLYDNPQEHCDADSSTEE